MTVIGKTALFTIGDLAARTGLSVSAIRFYEDRGLVHPLRSAGGQRRFLRSDIRRLSFVLIAQQLGLSIGEIAAQLAKLPENRAPTHAVACCRDATMWRYCQMLWMANHQAAIPAATLVMALAG